MTQGNEEHDGNNKVTIKEYLESKIEGIAVATTLASKILEKRLDGMNEFRNALKDQAANFITRAELESTLAKITLDVQNLRDFKSTLEGKASQGSVYISYAINIIGWVITILIAVLIKTRGG